MTDHAIKINSTPCPFCGEELYSLLSIRPASPERWAEIAAGAPQVETDYDINATDAYLHLMIHIDEDRRSAE